MSLRIRSLGLAALAGIGALGSAAALTATSPAAAPTRVHTAIVADIPPLECPPDWLDGNPPCPGAPNHPHLPPDPGPQPPTLF